MTTKYAVVDHVRHGDTFDVYYDTLDSALGAAEREWNHMSQSDRSRRSDYFVGPAEYSDDYECWVYTGHVIKAWKLNGEEV